MESIAQLFVYLTTNPKNRGKIVQDGGIRALLLLTHYNYANHNENGGHNSKIYMMAAHSIAKLAISVDPKIAFNDGTATRVISPLLSLLRNDSDNPLNGLQQFESLMALTNLALFGEETVSLMVRKREGK